MSDLSDFRSSDYLYGRDIEDRINWLDEDDMELDTDEKEELKILQAFEKEFNDYHEERLRDTSFINDKYFVRYAQDFADEIGAVGAGDTEWPSDHIDWEAAADDLQSDFTSIDLDGETFWYR